MLISFVLAAVLGVPDAGLASTPTVPEALVAQVTSPVGSDSAGCPVTTEPQVWGTVPAVAKPSNVALLVEAQVLEKYRSFRESLSAP